MTCDSDRPPQGENSRSEVECEAGQSGAESASPESCADAKVELVARLELVERIKQLRAERKRYFDVEGDVVDVLLGDCWAALEQSDAVMGETRLRLFDALKHGDQDHQDWLREAIGAHFDGEPVPAPRGSGNKEKRIAELEAEVARLSTPIAPVQDDDARKIRDFLDGGRGLTSKDLRRIASRLSRQAGGVK